MRIHQVLYNTFTLYGRHNNIHISLIHAYAHTSYVLFCVEPKPSYHCTTLFHLSMSASMASMKDDASNVDMNENSGVNSIYVDRDITKRKRKRSSLAAKAAPDTQSTNMDESKHTSYSSGKRWKEIDKKEEKGGVATNTTSRHEGKDGYAHNNYMHIHYVVVYEHMYVLSGMNTYMY